MPNANFLFECNRCDRRRDDTDVDDGRGHQRLKRADLQSQQRMNRFLHMGPVASMQAREQRIYGVPVPVALTEAQPRPLAPAGRSK